MPATRNFVPFMLIVSGTRIDFIFLFFVPVKRTVPFPVESALVILYVKFPTVCTFPTANGSSDGFATAGTVGDGTAGDGVTVLPGTGAG